MSIIRRRYYCSILQNQQNVFVDDKIFHTQYKNWSHTYHRQLSHGPAAVILDFQGGYKCKHLVGWYGSRYMKNCTLITEKVMSKLTSDKKFSYTFMYCFTSILTSTVTTMSEGNGIYIRKKLYSICSI